MSPRDLSVYCTSALKLQSKHHPTRLFLCGSSGSNSGLQAWPASTLLIEACPKTQKQHFEGMPAISDTKVGLTNAKPSWSDQWSWAKFTVLPNEKKRPSIYSSYLPLCNFFFPIASRRYNKRNYIYEVVIQLSSRVYDLLCVRSWVGFSAPKNK